MGIIFVLPMTKIVQGLSMPLNRGVIHPNCHDEIMTLSTTGKWKWIKFTGYGFQRFEFSSKDIRRFDLTSAARSLEPIEVKSDGFGPSRTHFQFCSEHF